VGVDDTGYDVKFYGATGGAYMLWDESADDLILAGAGGLVVAGNVDFNGDLDVDGTTNLDVVDIDGAVDMASTLAVGGVVTANAGVVVDNFTLDGTTLALSSGSMTLDSASQIILDAAGGNIQVLKSGTEFARIFESGSDFYIYNPISDKDIKFYGNDGGTSFTALTLDMSNLGRAIFNAGASFADHVYLADNAKLTLGDGDDGTLYSDGTNIIQTSTGDLTLDVAGDIILDADGADVIFKDGGTTFLEIDKDGNNARIKNPISDGDVLIQGTDSASVITALTFDMSAAGKATFNAGATFGGTIDQTSPSAFITIESTSASQNSQLNITSTVGTWLIGQNSLQASTGALEFNYEGAAKLAIASTGAATFSSTVTSTGLDCNGNADVSGTFDVAGNVEFATTQGLSYAGTKAAGLEIGTVASGGSLLVRTPSLNSSFSSGLMVDGAYSSEISQVNLTAAGVYSGGGYEGHLHLRTMSQTSIWPAITAKPNSLQFYTANTERMAIDSSGRVTMPFQPAFVVRPAIAQDNIAVNTNTTVVFGNEIVDRGSNFASNTFTAPVTGLYQLNVTVYFFDAQEAMTYIQVNLNTSNNVNYAVISTSAYENNAPYLSIGHSFLADMDASDTAFVQLQMGPGGSASTDITVNTQFSGYLVA
jgi:cytoskeletal protein CcmA (bactofilin family)